MNLAEIAALLDKITPENKDKFADHLNKACMDITKKVNSGDSDVKSQDIMNDEKFGCHDKLKNLVAMMSDKENMLEGLKTDGSTDKGKENL